MQRREFLIGATVATGVATVAIHGVRMSPAEAAQALGPESRDVGAAALTAAKSAGASFADVRVVLRRDRSVSAREQRVRSISESSSLGFNIRVLVDGAWGFVASDILTLAEASRVARQAVSIAKANRPYISDPVQLAPEPPYQGHWQTRITIDPFRVPIEQMVARLLSANKIAMQTKGVKFANSSLHFVHEAKLFMSSEGSVIEQDHYRLNPGLSATAVDVSGDFRTRNADFAPVSAGYEYVDELDWEGRAAFVGDEAIAYLSARPVQPGKRDLILAPSNLWLTIHETVGHPTELDRALGYEANYAGTSFATVDKLNNLKYGSRKVNFVADRTIARGLATVGFDDEGVKAQDWHIVKDGKFVGYQTTREQAGWIRQGRSKGCSYGQGWASVPFQRIPNLHMAAGDKELSLDDIVSDTKDAILVAGRGSWSIDHQRYNFQFSGGTFYEVKNGKIKGRLRDVAYQSNSLDLWRSCDAVGGKASWEMYGTFYDGKGEPPQSNACSHGCPPARFRNMNIINTGSKKS